MSDYFSPRPYSMVLAEIRETLNERADYPADSYNVDSIARACYVEVAGGLFAPRGRDGAAASSFADIDDRVMWSSVDEALLRVYRGRASVGGSTLFIEVRGFGGRLVDSVQVPAPGSVPGVETLEGALLLAGWVLLSVRGDVLSLGRA